MASLGKAMRSFSGLSRDAVQNRKSTRTEEVLKQGFAVRGREPTVDLLFRPEVSDLRCFLIRTFRTQQFDLACGVIILFNMVVVIIETDMGAKHGEQPSSSLTLANHVLLTIYAMELALKIYAFQIQFFHDRWNLVDFTVVLADLCSMLFGLISANLRGGGGSNWTILRLLRLVRLARAFKALHSLRELNHLIRGIAGAAKAIFWGMLLVVVILVLWGILAVQIIHPITEEIDVGDCADCARAFESVFMAMLTFYQQVVAGDSWGTISLPIIRAVPGTWVFFGAVMVTVNLLMLNLILAIIVEAATAVRDEDTSRVAEEQNKKMIEMKRRLVDICAQMDNDHSGSLNVDELLKAYDTVDEFADILHTMEIERHDIDLIFDVLDEDGSGDNIQIHRLENHHGVPGGKVGGIPLGSSEENTKATPSPAFPPRKEEAMIMDVSSSAATCWMCRAGEWRGIGPINEDQPGSSKDGGEHGIRSDPVFSTSRKLEEEPVGLENLNRLDVITEDLARMTKAAEHDTKAQLSILMKISDELKCVHDLTCVLTNADASQTQRVASLVPSNLPSVGRSSQPQMEQAVGKLEEKAVNDKVPDKVAVPMCCGGISQPTDDRVIPRFNEYRAV